MQLKVNTGVCKYYGISALLTINFYTAISVIYH